MLFQKTFNSSWTVLCFCALSTGWFGGTPGNIKLINFTKRTGRRTTKTGRQTGVQQAGWQLITAMMRGENCRCHNQKNMAASTLLQVMHNHPHTHTHTHVHPSTHTHTALIHLPKTCTLLFFKFFCPHHPHQSSRSHASPEGDWLTASDGPEQGGWRWERDSWCHKTGAGPQSVFLGW